LPSSAPAPSSAAPGAAEKGGLAAAPPLDEEAERAAAAKEAERAERVAAELAALRAGAHRGRAIVGRQAAQALCRQFSYSCTHKLLVA